MSKVLVFCSDVLPLDGLGTSGGGMRSWQIVKGLEAHGHEVVYSMPWNRYLRRKFNDNIPEDVKKRLWTDSNQDEIIRGEKPDVIVCVKPSTQKWKDNHQIPIAVDFHGPDLIEFEQMAKNLLPMARLTLATRKLHAISMGDFFTCAGKRQRYYFMAFLMLAGIDIDDLKIHYMPVAMSPDLPEHEPDLVRRSVIFSGGFYPWLNPMPSLNALAAELLALGRGSLEIYGGSHETNAEEKRDFDNFQRELSTNPLVSFHGFVPRERVLNAYRTGYVAFELMPQNPERELAFTTRTVEFLWAGLPVIYNDYAELSDMIRDYNAGWLITPDGKNGLHDIVLEIMNNPDRVAEASANAKRLVREKLLYDEVIMPLAEFCRNPKMRLRSGDANYLIIPSHKAGFGYLDHLYLHYRRLPFPQFIKAVYAAVKVLAKNRLDNLRNV